MRYLALFLTLTILGCDHVNRPNTGRNDPYLARQIHFATKELENDTAVGTSKLSRDDSGLLFITIPVRSAIDKRLYVDYRVTFFDDNHQPIGKTSWFTKTLEANTPDQITINSTSPRVADFQVDFRYAK